MSAWKNPFSAAFRDLAQRPRGNTPALDVLRSAAILLVLSLHVGEFFPLRIRNLPFVLYGWSGVDLFFVLSGFLIGGQLWKELKRDGDVNVGRFILRRGYRIWPLYYTFILVVGGVALLRGQLSRAFLSDFFCVSNYFHHKIAGGWSLSTEEQFYVLVPTMLWAGSRLLRRRSLVVLPILWLFLLPLFRWLTVRAAGHANGLYFPFHTHSDGLAMGLILAWIAVSRPAWMRSALGLNLLVPVAGLAVGLALRYTDQAVFRFSSLAVIYGSLVFFLLRASRLPGAVNFHAFYIVSRLSYGMYLNHFHVVDLIPWLKSLVGEGLVGFSICFLVSMVLSLAGAYITFALIEVPFLKLRERWIARTKAAALATP
jgi:peptidoglycan/LPS O-acetylase OafA/YrhL